MLRVFVANFIFYLKIESTKNLQNLLAFVTRQQEARQNGRRERLKKKMKNLPLLTTQENKSVTVE